MVVNPHQESVLAGNEEHQYISDAAEYTNLKQRLANGDAITANNIERLAFTLCKWCLDFLSEEELEQTPEELNLLFACNKSLPDSPFVLDMLCDAALYCVYAAAEQLTFNTANSTLNRLHKLLAQAPNNMRLARSCVHGNILLLSEYLDAEDAPEQAPEHAPQQAAKRQYNELQTLASAYLATDLEIQGMLGWAKRLFIAQALYNDELDKAQQGLKDLAEYLGQYSGNALVACEYATACHLAAGKGINGLWHELARLAKEYSPAYRAYGETSEAVHFPTYYEPDRLICLLIDVVSDAAVNATENNNLSQLLEFVHLIHAQPFAPEEEHRRFVLQSQLHSNLLMLYGNAGEYTSAHNVLEYMRTLAEQSKDEPESYQIVLNALSDALYNLGKDYIDEDHERHHTAIRMLLSELEELAIQTDDSHQHSRYAALLYNLAGELEYRKLNFQPVWERLFNYVMTHTVFEDIALSVAKEERDLSIKATDIKTVFTHQKRVEYIAQHPEYCDFALVQEQLASASYNLLVLAGNDEYLQLAQLMLDVLAQLAAKSPDNLEIILRLVKGAHNMVIDYGNIGDIPHAEAAYKSMFPAATAFLANPEIANRAVKAGYNLCIDLINAKRFADIGNIYKPIRNACPNEEATEYFAKVTAWVKKYGQ